MVRRRAPHLTPEQLADVTLAALRNARRLLADAQLLIENGRLATAHALAVLALEELGKHVMCASAVICIHGDPDYAARFMGRFVDHEDKLRNARLLLDGLADAPGAPSTVREVERVVERTARSDARHKLRGLYVDLDRRGQVLEPERGVRGRDAIELIAAVDTLISLGEKMFSDRARVVRAFEQLASDAVAQNARAEALADDLPALRRVSSDMRAMLEGDEEAARRMASFWSGLARSGDTV